MQTDLLNRRDLIEKLNQILQHELAGVVRYTHYSFIVFGNSRIPVVGWFRGAASETLTHATEAGEMITMLGGQPPLGIGDLLDTHEHNMEAILKESIAFEVDGIVLYRDLLTLAEQAGSITLQEYALRLISEEAVHICEIDKMLRRPGESEQAVKKEVPYSYIREVCQPSV